MNDNFTYHEVYWDYDWILFKTNKITHEKINIHTWKTFQDEKEREKFSCLYQYDRWQLVWYSIYEAQGLHIEDDINLPENFLWWSRTNWEIIFKPIKKLSKEHIQNILDTQSSIKEEYLLIFNKILWKH